MVAALSSLAHSRHLALFGRRSLIGSAVSAHCARRATRPGGSQCHSTPRSRASPTTLLKKVSLRLLTFALHLIQPVARLRGRLRFGLTPWRRPWMVRSQHSPTTDRQCGARTSGQPETGSGNRVQAPGRRVHHPAGAATSTIGISTSGRALCRHSPPDGDRGAWWRRQLARFRLWPVWSPLVVVAPILLALAVAAWVADEPVVAAALLSGAALVAARTLQEGAAATAGGPRRTVASAKQDDGHGA